MTTIQIEPETRDQLKQLGKKGDSYNTIIVNLLKEDNSIGNKKEKDVTKTTNPKSAFNDVIRVDTNNEEEACN